MVKLEDGIFEQAVKVHGARAGQVQHIGSARKAAEWLLNEWPMKIDTGKARAARKACLEVLEGQREAAAARKAFREAAVEAGILIEDEILR
jgi:undecaprenyl pyrophosphate synthase